MHKYKVHVNKHTLRPQKTIISE